MRTYIYAYYIFVLVFIEGSGLGNTHTCMYVWGCVYTDFYYLACKDSTLIICEALRRWDFVVVETAQARFSVSILCLPEGSNYFIIIYLPKNLYDHYYQNPKHLAIGHWDLAARELDPVGLSQELAQSSC